MKPHPSDTLIAGWQRENEAQEKAQYATEMLDGFEEPLTDG